MINEQRIRPSKRTTIMQVLMNFARMQHPFTPLSDNDRDVIAVLAQNIKRIMKWLRSASFTFAEIGHFDILVQSEHYDSRLSRIMEILNDDSEKISRSIIKKKINNELAQKISLIDLIMSEKTELMLDLVYSLNPSNVRAVRKAFENLEKSVAEIEHDVESRKRLIGNIKGYYLL
jgi:hypothetical protein